MPVPSALSPSSPQGPLSQPALCLSAALPIRFSSSISSPSICLFGKYYSTSTPGFEFRRNIRGILVQRGVIENLFNAHSEEPGGPEGEWQAGIELARLDGVDGLPGHIERVRQLGLRPIALGAQHLESVLHR